jgi:hypothetical protein
MAANPEVVESQPARAATKRIAAKERKERKKTMSGFGGGFRFFPCGSMFLTGIIRKAGLSPCLAMYLCSHFVAFLQKQPPTPNRTNQS